MIHKKLAERREALAKEMRKGTYNQEVFKLGFDSACAELLPLLEKAMRAMDNYKKVLGYSIADPTINPNILDRTEHLIPQALTAHEEIKAALEGE